MKKVTPLGWSLFNGGQPASNEQVQEAVQVGGDEVRVTADFLGGNPTKILKTLDESLMILMNILDEHFWMNIG